MIPSKDKYPDNIVNSNFDGLLKKFNKAIENYPPPEKIKSQLLEIKQEAISKVITPHQKDAITARCNNYLNGTYASTSREYKVHVHTK